MAAANNVYLSNPVITIGSFAATGFCTSAVFTKTLTSQDTTVFGQTARTYQATLEDNELVVTLYLTYAASEVYSSLKDLVGTQLNVTAQPAAGAKSATNPEFKLTNTYLESLPVVSAKLGEMSTIDLTFKGGSYSVAVA